MSGEPGLWTLFVMTPKPVRARLRRLAVLVLGLALLGQLAVVVGAGPAAAQPCDPDANPSCPPIPVTTYDSTITVTPPDHGTVYGRAAGATTDAIVCSAADSSRCSVVDSLDGYTRPTSGWPSYSFTYAGPGYAGEWGGACSGIAACTITNSRPTTTLTVVTHDVAPPVVTVNAPARIGPTTSMTATASDNSGSVTRYDWSLCRPDGTDCAALASGQSATAVTIDRHPAGNYRVVVQARDASGNIGSSSAQIEYVDGVVLSYQTLPPVTEAPSFWFRSDDEAHVPSDDGHRRCRAFPAGTTPPAWGPCTTSTTYAPAVADGRWTLQADEIDDLGLEASVTQDTTVDTTAPVLAFAGGPAEGAVVASPTVGIGFTATDLTLASTTCRLDAAAPAPCTSPYALSRYADGPHTVTVTATDQLGHRTSLVRHFAAAVPTSVSPASARVRTTYGRSAVLAATVSPAAALGTVRFTTTSGAVLCTAAVRSGRATCSTSPRVGAGAWAVTGTYRGGYLPSTTRLTLDVARAATAVSVRMAATVHRGHRVTVTAYHLPSTATGTVTVSRKGHRLCSARVGRGSARCSFVARLSTGRYHIVAAYGGDRNHLASHRTVTMRVVR
jgi:hypothetical protein